MKDDNNKEINSIFDDSNQKKLSNFSSHLNDDYEENSTTPKNSTNKTIKIKLNETNFIDDFKYENELINEKVERNFSFNDFTSIENKTEEESFGFDSIINYEYNFSTYIEKLNYLINNIDKQFVKNIKKPIIKCLLGEIEENNNKECNNIPLITKKKFGISFYCDNHNNKNNTIIGIFSLIKNINKILIESPRLIQNNNNENFYNDINFLKENMIKFTLNTSSLKRKIQIFKTDIRKSLNRKIKDFKDLLNDYNNKNKYDESFRAQSLKRIKNIYIAFIKKLNLLIYLIIINRILYEYRYLNILSYKNKINLLINLKNAVVLIEGNKYKISNKSKKKKIKKKTKKHNLFRFNWITEFYFEEEMKSNINKNVFIATDDMGVIYILLIYFKSTNEISIEEKANVYELINAKKINNFRPYRIIKLKKLFNVKDIDNYFIINSMKNIEIGKAIIINVIENNNYIDIKERYKIEIIQTIQDANGLYSSMEFFYNDKAYLVSFYINFYLWIYNPEINKIENNIENKINNDNKSFNYGPLIYEESKKLFIIQCILPKLIIEFYKLEEENNILTFKKIDRMIEFKEEESTLKINNNYYIHKNRFLLLSSGKMKNNTSGGIYVIDLEKFELISFHRFSNYIAINSMIPSKRNNTIIVSSIIKHKRYPKSLKDKSNGKNDNNNNNNIDYMFRGRLITMEIKTENDKISFKIQNFSEGQFYFINCKNLILDEYFFTSFHKNNNLIKLKENGKFIQYFKINN